MYKAEEIAQWFIARSLSEDDGKNEGEDGITHLKLQKLLYYAQGCYLAIYDKPLFSENIVAWKYGPVVEEVYEKFKRYRGKPLKIQEGVSIIGMNLTVQGFLEDIYQIWGQYSARKLVTTTHAETPFKITMQGDVISHEEIKKYFLKHHIED
jgi:uncharacterized phage-associated protein